MPKTRGGQPVSIELRLWPRIIKDPGGCWVWQGSRGNYGYGQVIFNGRLHRTHRVAWELTHGLIPPGVEVCHACDNPPCINPAHLFLGTHQANMADMSRKGRSPAGKKNPGLQGERNGFSKLTDTAVMEARTLRSQGLSFSKIGAKFGVTAQAIFQALKGKTWGHIKEQDHGGH